MSFYTKPPGAFDCWARSYDGADRECGKCEYQTTCRNEFSRRNGIPQTGVAPMPQQFHPWAQQHQTPSAMPQPPRIMQPQQMYSPGQVMPPQVVAVPPMPQQNQAQPYDSFAAYYGQFEGESRGQRFMKLTALHMMQTLFLDLSTFCGVWKWEPPSGRQ